MINIHVLSRCIVWDGPFCSGLCLDKWIVNTCLSIYGMWHMECACWNTNIMIIYFPLYFSEIMEYSQRNRVEYKKRCMTKYLNNAEHVRTTFSYSGIPNFKKCISTKKRKKMHPNIKNRGVAPCCGRSKTYCENLQRIRQPKNQSELLHFPHPFFSFPVYPHTHHTFPHTCTGA